MYNSELPIDIHCTKLVDWLIQRRHCKRDWGEKLGVIRRKIRIALQDMPEHEKIKELLTNARIDYYKSKQIVEILKTTEANTKNFFGYYSSQRIKDWQEIVSLYEQDCVYLSEIAANVIREVNYEIPGIKKNMSRCRKEIEDLEKECANLVKQAQHFKNEYNRLAQSYGIKGTSDIASELEEELKFLPSIIENIVTLSKNLAPAVEFYRQFGQLTCRNVSSTMQKPLFVSLVGHVVEKGNTTTYEYRYGIPPESVELPDPPVGVARRKTSKSSQTSNVSNEDEIDFGEDATSSESSSGFVHLNSEKQSGEEATQDDDIDFGDEANGEVADMTDSVTTCVEVGGTKVARGDEARTILDLKSTCEDFVNELYELEAFLAQRLFESKNEVLTFTSDESSRARNYDENELNEMLSNVKKIIDIFSVGRNKALFQMRDSPEYVNGIVERLNSKLAMSEKRMAKHAICKEQIEELFSQLKELEIHLKKSLEKGRETQKQFEVSLSDMYRGRRVNIMGGLN